MLNKLISQFIWQDKRPRIKLKTLQLAKRKLALPSFYHWPAQLTATVTWISGNEKTKWRQIDLGEAKGAMLSVLPFIDLKHFNKLKIEGSMWDQGFRRWADKGLVILNQL